MPVALDCASDPFVSQMCNRQFDVTPYAMSPQGPIMRIMSQRTLHKYSGEMNKSDDLCVVSTMLSDFKKQKLLDYSRDAVCLMQEEIFSRYLPA